MATAIENMIWSEKYRPKTIDECILPESIKEQARNFVKSGQVPTLLFTGSAGCGKTTLARAIANELDADFMIVNASMEGNVDLIRNKLSNFASTVSFTDGRKVTLLDEADGLTPAAQQALRGFIEDFSSNHSIIFTCNYASKIIDPIKSRSHIINFKFTREDKNELSVQFAKRIFSILENENIDFDKKAVIQVIQKNFPDFRSVLNELQGYAAGGIIDASIIDFSDKIYDNLLIILKEKKFNDMIKWVSENSDVSSDRLFKSLYDSASKNVTPQSLPALIDILGNWNSKSGICANQWINNATCLSEIMCSSTIEWK